VIATKGTPWNDLAEYKCGWWIDQGVDALASVLANVVLLDDTTRAEMGKRGRKLVEDKYTWDAVCNKMIKGYEEVLNA
jgi:glycosyltransferase involved in cell wall biosynthesis